MVSGSALLSACPSGDLSSWPPLFTGVVRGLLFFLLDVELLSPRKQQFCMVTTPCTPLESAKIGFCRVIPRLGSAGGHGSARGCALWLNSPLFVCVAGLADPSALTHAVATYQGCHFIGMPECEVRPLPYAVTLGGASLGLDHGGGRLALRPPSGSLDAVREGPRCRQGLMWAPQRCSGFPGGRSLRRAEQDVSASSPTDRAAPA